MWPVAGPVHLNLAFRNPLVPVPDAAGFPFDLDGRPAGKPWTEATGSPLQAGEDDLARLQTELEATERGLIVAGTSDLDPAPIVELARVLGWPLLAEATSNARRGPNAISTYDALLRVKGFWETHRPELVLRFGHIGTSNQLAAALDPSLRQIAVNPAAWLDPTRAVSWMIRADPDQVCRGLCSRIEPRPGSAWLDEWLEAESKARRAIDSFLDNHQQLSEPGIARDMASALPPGSNLVVASSMPVRDLDWFMRSSPGVTVRANRGANGIDGFVSSCLGIALSQTRRPTVGLSGDLSFLHDQNGFLLASGSTPDVVFVVVNNNGGGIFSFLPQAAEPEFERLFGTPPNHDFALLAKSYGCTYRSIHRSSALAPAVSQAVSIGGAHILEARTDRVENVKIHNLIWSKVSDAVGSADRKKS
jgi:2-succinyl-5-enolpyruvyl-6-hydroxy-3-cyclohexene-1-carboxylate synthase